jgi:hypothetical protein
LSKCGYCSLGNCNVLLNGSGARSDGADDAPVDDRIIRTADCGMPMAFARIVDTVNCGIE